MELPLAVLSGWLLLVATIISIAYEWWRATARAGVGPNDSIRAWVMGLPLYLVAGTVSLLLILEWPLAPILGLAIALFAVLASTFWYGPSILVARRPALIDWMEDRVFTMLVGIVAVLLAADMLGVTLTVA